MIDAKKTIAHARRKLGEPIIKIELDEEQMITLLKDAHETFYLYAEIAEIGWQNKDKIEDAWIKKYFYALCKETLGRIRESLSNSDNAGLVSYKNLLIEADKEKLFLKYAIFRDKELLSWANVDNAVLVFYVNVRGMDPQEINFFIEKFRLKSEIPEGFTSYFIPTRESETRVECIYPVSKELDANSEHVIDRLNSYLKDTESDLLNSEENKDE